MNSSKLTSLPTLALLSMILVFSSCRERCREIGEGGYWTKDDEGPDGPGPCFSTDGLDGPRPFVAILSPREGSWPSRERPMPIEILFGDNRGLSEASISLSTTGQEYFTTTVDLSGGRDTFLQELQLSGRDILGTHHIEVTVTDNVGLTATKAHDFTVFDDRSPTLIDPVTYGDVTIGDDLEFNVSFFDQSGIASMSAEFFLFESIFDPTTGKQTHYADGVMVSAQSIDLDDLPDVGQFQGVFSTSNLPLGQFEIVFKALDGAGITRTERASGSLLKL